MINKIEMNSDNYFQIGEEERKLPVFKWKTSRQENPPNSIDWLVIENKWVYESIDCEI